MIVLLEVAGFLALSALLAAAELERRRFRTEARLSAKLLERVSGEASIRLGLRLLMHELLSAFGARRALVAVRDGQSSRVYLWSFRRREAPGRTGATITDLPPSAQRPYLLDDACGALRIRSRDAAAPRAALDALAVHGCASALTAPFRSGEQWEGRVWLLDPARHRLSAAGLRLFERLTGQAAPVLYTAYVRRRLQSQATAAARARVARELHDGVIQSLTSLEVQLDVLRRRNGAGPATPEELGRLQHQLRDEVLNLRELIQHMRPLDVGPRELLEFLASHVSRFARETGIEATFHSDLAEVPFPARKCSELARIVQEALVNVRKHSRARHVLVRLCRENGHYKVVIDDDGRGFGFSGCLDQAALDSGRKGPVIIKERVRAIAGSLSIDSRPERGARLEITVPR